MLASGRVERLEQRRRAEPGAEVGPVQALARAGEQDEAHEVGDVALELGLLEPARAGQPVRVPRRPHWACTFVWKPLTSAVPCGALRRVHAQRRPRSRAGPASDSTVDARRRHQPLHASGTATARPRR